MKIYYAGSKAGSTKQIENFLLCRFAARLLSFFEVGGSLFNAHKSFLIWKGAMKNENQQR